MSLLHPQSFVYLRHGETDWNRDGRLQGNIDIPLNARGIAQAQAAWDALRGQGLTRVYHSPLSRARRTAEIVNQELGLPMQEVVDLREASFGRMEGLVTERGEGSWYQTWLAGKQTPRGGESFEDFVVRSLAAINHCLADAAGRGDHPLIVAHGGVYWAVRRGAGLGYEGPIGNARPRLHLPRPGPHGLEWKLDDLPLSTASGAIT